jgi:hypothetical protein
MPKTSTKFAKVLGVSVSKETFDRANKLQQYWDKICLEKFDQRFRMSDLGELVWNIALGILEDLPPATMMDTLATKHLNEDTLKVEIRKARKMLKHPRTLSSLTDDQIAAMTSGKGGPTEE